jgi:hypothetical protein
MDDVDSAPLSSAEFRLSAFPTNDGDLIDVSFTMTFKDGGVLDLPIQAPLRSVSQPCS